MSERKNINKYQKIEKQYKKKLRSRLGGGKKNLVRFMLPFDIRCDDCLIVLNQGKKLNGLKERVLTEEYLGIKLFRFYFKCPNCTGSFSLRTDPKNSCYFPEINCKKIIT
mmetsp:Transcript_61251/g.126526  ORF Transcript_61251/g.126526 Transcript_61251/m.126526 type:complete len:110 (+) Transcript_61251:2924-3253(+)